MPGTFPRLPAANQQVGLRPFCRLRLFDVDTQAHEALMGTGYVTSSEGANIVAKLSTVISPVRISQMASKSIPRFLVSLMLFISLCDLLR